LFVTKKTAKYFQMKRNPRKLPWTMFYRHLHRKGNANEDAKKSKVCSYASHPPTPPHSPCSLRFAVLASALLPCCSVVSPASPLRT
jgi:hypothetical protein